VVLSGERRWELGRAPKIVLARQLVDIIAEAMQAGPS